jgi:glutamate racemase
VSDDRPIGIFDSGIGGLTVLAALTARLPHERFIYLGDTARLPYGTKSAETVKRYALRAGLFLAQHDIKMLVVACNTASAAALPVLEHALTVPVVGVVEPGARAAVRVSSGRIGVIATESTITSGAYEQAVKHLQPESTVVARPCPLFVPLAEEGWFDHPVTLEVARIYLQPMVEQGIDTLILGCTHYPLLRPAIAAALGRDVRLVDSASAVAEVVAEMVTAAQGDYAGDSGAVELLVTDAAARFSRMARLIVPEHSGQLRLVDLPL